MNITITETSPGFDAVIIYIGLITFSFTLSFVATGILIYKHPIDIPNPYHLKYYDRFVEIEEVELNDDIKNNLKTTFTKASTDDGKDVIICYNADISAFQIWSDKIIPFLSLDAIAQLYAIDNNCKIVCIDYKNEITESNQVSKPLSKKNKISPFALYKNYNRKISTSNKVYSIPKKCNHFRHSGRIEDWEKIHMSLGYWKDTENAKTWIYNKVNIDTSQNTLKLSYSEWKQKNN